jgi:glycosyltransferase involved in cell wall biosynthesis
MRVLHIMAANGNGGAELYSTDIMLTLHEAGLDQCVVMRPTAPRFAELAAAGLRMAPNILSPNIKPLQRLKLARLIAAETPTIIQCWMRRAAALIPATPACPTIGWYGDYEDAEHFSACTHFAGVTPGLVTHMHATGIAPDRATCIPTFSSVDSAPALDPATLGTPPGTKILLTLSRLHHTKGLDTLIRALPALPACHLWLAGDGPELQNLKALAAALNLIDRVKFLGWRTDRGALLRAAHICILPSRYEPFGTVILDAWSAGTPLVACASAGPAAAISNGVNGLLTPIDVPAALAAAITAILTDETLKSTLTANAAAAVAAKFSRRAVTAQYLAYYERLAAESLTKSSQPRAPVPTLHLAG